jgi:Arabinose-binding domain of AraC transcription regulator, N-term
MTKQKRRDETLALGSKASAARSVIDVGYVNLVMSGIRKSGRNVDHILIRAGLDPHRLAEPNGRFSQREFARLISVLIRTTRDEFWSLCSRPIKPGTFRMMCKLLIRPPLRVISQHYTSPYLVIDVKRRNEDDIRARN